MNDNSRYEFTRKEISFYRAFESNYRKMKRVFPVVLILLSVQLLVHLWKIHQITGGCLPYKAQAYYIYPVLILFCVIWMLIIEMKQIAKFVSHAKKLEEAILSRRDNIQLLFHDNI